MKTETVRLCRNCECRSANRAGSLCVACFRDTAARERHPRKTIHPPRPSAVLPEPTDARPGTEAKMLVLQDRAARGLALFHPDDAVWDGQMSFLLALEPDEADEDDTDED